MKFVSEKQNQIWLAFTLAAVSLGSSSVFAATIQVPTGQLTIAAAIAAANTNDEIRVQSTHLETSFANLVSSKNLTIVSYDASYTTPTAGAQWNATGTPATEGALHITNSTVVLQGFRDVQVTGGSGFYLDAGSNLTVNDTTFTQTKSAGSAVFLSEAAAGGASLTLNNVVLTDIGRGIFFNTVSGTNNVTINNTTFNLATSYAIEFRTATGIHTFALNNSTYIHNLNQSLRIYGFNATSGVAQTNATFSGNKFVLSGTAGTAITVGGVDLATAVDPSSFQHVTFTNNVVDLRNAPATASGISSLNGAQSADVVARHNTFIEGNASQSALKTSNFKGAWSLQNSIVDGPGFAFSNGGTGATMTIASGKNLLNTAAGISTGTNAANVTLSGTEITGTSPSFVDRTNGDFNLTLGSAAIDQGAGLGVATDIAGTARDASPDLGAYEYTSVPSTVSDWTVYN